jgi:glycosyltransferase involved in cell wall biosynthesis
MPPIEILHLVYGHYPADSRVKREVLALRATGKRLAVISVQSAGEPATERIDGVVAIRVPGRKSRGGFLSYLREYGEFVLRCRRLVASHRALAHVQVVHVHTLPDFLMWAALPAKRRGARVVFDMHEIFPEFASAKFAGLLGAGVAGVARRIERWARRNADVTITVNRPIDELLKARPASDSEQRIVVHNTADPQDFRRSAQTVSQIPRGGSLQLVYHGTLTHLYGLDVAIRGIAQANRDGHNVRLTIIGDGPLRAYLEQMARTVAKPGAVILEAPITHKMLATRLPRFHAGVVPTRLNGMTRYSLSTKLLEYVQLGLPVLAADLPSYRLYFGAETLWFWTPGDPASLADAISTFLKSDGQQRAGRVARAQQLLEPLAWDIQANMLLATYAQLLSGGAHEAARMSATRSAAVPSP